jgi:hypothetical protein
MLNCTRASFWFAIFDDTDTSTWTLCDDSAEAPVAIAGNTWLGATFGVGSVPIAVALPETAMESELSLVELVNSACEECVAITANAVAGTKESRRATTNNLGIAIDISYS